MVIDALAWTAQHGVIWVVGTLTPTADSTHKPGLYHTNSTTAPTDLALQLAGDF